MYNKTTYNNKCRQIYYLINRNRKFIMVLRKQLGETSYIFPHNGHAVSPDCVRNDNIDFTIGIYRSGLSGRRYTRYNRTPNKIFA